MINNPLINNSRIKLLTLIILTLFTTNLSAQALITKDQPIDLRSTPIIIAEKATYNINETAQIFGMNYQSFERVRMNVNYLDKNLNQQVLLGTFDVYADAKGYISAEWRVIDVNQPDTLFTVVAIGTSTGINSKTEFSTSLFAGEAVNVDQCANTDASPQTLECPNVPSAGWVNGNANANKAKYFEGDSIAYRAKFTNLTPGHSYTFQIGYDTTEGSINTLDYLTTYNRTITNANPCREGANPNVHCTAGAPDSTIAIPIDSNVTNGRDTINGTSDDITQIPGVFSLWDGTFTGVSGYTYDPGFPSGNIGTSISVTFTATATTAVIAWGGHISTRDDWGEAFGSVNRTGSPYHTRNEGLTNNTDATSCCSGQQELQLAAGAITPSAKIIIIKHATPPSPQQFGFTTTNLSPGNFTLVDNSISTDPMQVFDNITDFNVKTITESSMGSYDLISIVCTVDIGTGGTPAPVQNGDSISIDIQPGDQVTCTFNNDFVTAAAVTVSGKVLDSSGNGLGRAYVSMTDGSGNLRTTISNQFGYFKFDNVEAGDNYFIDVRHKGFVFTPQLVNVSGEITGLTFAPSN